MAEVLGTMFLFKEVVLIVVVEGQREENTWQIRRRYFGAAPGNKSPFSPLFKIFCR